VSKEQQKDVSNQKLSTSLTSPLKTKKSTDTKSKIKTKTTPKTSDASRYTNETTKKEDNKQNETEVTLISSQGENKSTSDNSDEKEQLVEEHKPDQKKIEPNKEKEIDNSQESGTTQNIKSEQNQQEVKQSNQIFLTHSYYFFLCLYTEHFLIII
jgi:hypothetical protein